MARWYSGRSASNFRSWVVLTCILLSSGCCTTSHTRDYTSARSRKRWYTRRNVLFNRFHARGNQIVIACKAFTADYGDACVWPVRLYSCVCTSRMHVEHMLLQVSSSRLPRGHTKASSGKLSVLYLQCSSSQSDVLTANRNPCCARCATCTKLRSA